MNKIYVTNFINATEPALESFFSHVAPVKSVKLMSNATHMYAFVEYEDVHGAQRAVELFNGKDFQVDSCVWNLHAPCIVIVAGISLEYP